MAVGVAVASWHHQSGRLRKRSMLQPREVTYLYVGYLFALGRKRGDQAAGGREDRGMSRWLKWMGEGGHSSTYGAQRFNV